MTLALPSKGLLRWRCRRGMRELDAALVAYLDHHFDTAQADEQQAFCQLLDIPDPALIRLIAGSSDENDDVGGYGISTLPTPQLTPEMDAGPHASAMPGQSTQLNVVEPTQGRTGNVNTGTTEHEFTSGRQPDSHCFATIIDKIRATLTAD